MCSSVRINGQFMGGLIGLPSNFTAPRIPSHLLPHCSFMKADKFSYAVKKEEYDKYFRWDWAVYGGGWER